MNEMNPADRNLAQLFLALQSLEKLSDQDLLNFYKADYNLIWQLPDYSMATILSLNYAPITNALTSEVGHSQWRWERKLRDADRTLAVAKLEQVTVLMPHMDYYPKRLLKFNQAPVLLFCLGDPARLNDEKIINLIGNNQPTDAGQKLSQHLIDKLTAKDVTVLCGTKTISNYQFATSMITNGTKGIMVSADRIDNFHLFGPNKVIENFINAGNAIVSTCRPSLERDDLTKPNIMACFWQAGLSDGAIVSEIATNNTDFLAVKNALNLAHPVGVFDYRQTKLASQMTTNPNLSGNMACLQNQQSVSINSMTSIEQFLTQIN